MPVARTLDKIKMKLRRQNSIKFEQRQRFSKCLELIFILAVLVITSW